MLETRVERGGEGCTHYIDSLDGNSITGSADFNGDMLHKRIQWQVRWFRGTCVVCGYVKQWTVICRKTKLRSFQISN